MATDESITALSESLQEIHDTEESLLKYAKDVISEPGGYELFVNNKIGKLFGLALTYRKAFERHNVTTKEQFDLLVKRNFRDGRIQELEEEIHQLETDWDNLLQNVDQKLEVDNSNVLQVGSMGPVDTELIDARTGAVVSLQNYLGSENLVLILLRHFA